MIRISDEVRTGLAEHRPVVAPSATIAVIDGVPRIGLSADEMEEIAFRDGVLKLSARDLPLAAAAALRVR